MPGKAIGVSMLIGYPGTYSRNGDFVMSRKLVKSTDPQGVYFGDPVMLNSGGVTGGVISSAYDGYASFSATNFFGIAAREIKSFETYVSAALGLYAPGLPADILERGSITVVVHRGTPTAGGTVYVRTVLGGTPDSGAVLGGFEAAVAADGGTLITLTNAKWTTGLTSIDANGFTIAEVTLLTRNI